MKPILYSLLFLLIPKLAVSQTSENHKLNFSINDKLIHLDTTYLETTSKDFKYIRIIKDYKLDKPSYTFLEYYKSGVLRMESTSKSKDVLNKEGKETRYYENGNKKSLTHYNKGHKNGSDFEWYENGNKKSEGEYIEGEKKEPTQYKINQFWDENGVQKVVDGNGFLEDNDEKGEIKKGFKEGVWEGVFKKTKISYKESYKSGKLISGESRDENNVSYQYTEIEVRPEYKKGMPAFYQYIAKNYNISKDLPRGTKGKIYLRFVVDKDGKIIEPKVLRDLGYGTGEEAIRVINNSENWKPGEQRGMPVRCTYSLPISIQSAN